MAETTAPIRRASAGAALRVGVVGAIALVAVIAVGLAWPNSEWSRTGPAVTVAGWAPYWQPEASLASFEANSDVFADISLVAYSATGATAIDRYPSLTDEVVGTFRRAATEARVPLIATIFDDAPPATMAAVLADPAQRAAHVDTIVAVVTDNDFDGVDLDYETFAFEDDRSSWATTRPNWIAFLSELGTKLHASGHQLIVSVPPVYDSGQTDASGYWVYDHAAMGPIVDRIRVMAYDYSVMGGEPGPIAPIEWVQSLVDNLVELVPPDKVDLGIPAYGYDWVLGINGSCPADQVPENDVISTSRATRLIAERGLTPAWDPVTGEASLDYTDVIDGADTSGSPISCTVTRTVRYLDARSLHLRTYLAHRNDLHGVAVWALGYDDDTVWQAIGAARRGEDTWPAAPT